MAAITPKHLLQPAEGDSPARGHNSNPLRHVGRLAIEYVSIDQLRPDGAHARVHPKKQVGQIAASMQAFGNIVPILANADGRVIAGHGRLLAAQRLGLTEVPVVRVEHLTHGQIRAFQIADNKLTENGEWDGKLLGEAFRELELLDLDFDLSVTGFEPAEIDLTIASLDDGGEDDDDELSPPGPLVTRPGDIWEMIVHRLGCCDALNEASYRAVMPDEQAAMIVADVPYNVPIQGNAAGFGKVKYEEFAQASGEMTEAEYTAFLLTAFLCIAAVAAAGALAYVFIDWRHLFEMTVAARRAFAVQRNLVVWDKGVGGQGSFYRSQHELVSVWTAKAGKSRNNIQLGRFGRSRSNVWAYASPSRLGHAGEEGRLTLDHPTPKPPTLIADAILDCTERGDIVLDPFLGGGATLIAAERTGRRCRGIEIEPRFVDAAIRRLRRLTGEDARRVGDGRMFSDLEREAADEQ